MAEWQVQSSKDGQTWEPRQPRDDQPNHGMDLGDHWFTDEGLARLYGQHLRNALTWSEIRIAEQVDGEIVSTRAVL